MWKSSHQSQMVPSHEQRSHEQNQERAYVAASRRTDRSTEARIQSAKMASEVHKRRTGRPFKISEEIVLDEEMYEEEEDANLAGSYGALSGQHWSSSLSARNRMDILAHQEAINRMFAEIFPGIAGISQQPAPFIPRPLLDAGSSTGMLPNSWDGLSPVSEDWIPGDHKLTEMATDTFVDEEELLVPALSPPSSRPGTSSDLPTPPSPTATVLSSQPMVSEDPKLPPQTFSARNPVEAGFMINENITGSLTGTLHDDSNEVVDNAYSYLPDDHLASLTAARMKPQALDPYFGFFHHTVVPECNRDDGTTGDNWGGLIDPSLWPDNYWED
ncbi:hypothetical protein GQ53DRAFT_754982 [Thozetella sp. PMI_491]|nr:hypothetical protein GQ53DRAFT_754982 [Thozetella sp. PMI_491]